MLFHNTFCVWIGCLFFFSGSMLAKIVQKWVQDEWGMKALKDLSGSFTSILRHCYRVMYSNISSFCWWLQRRHGLTGSQWVRYLSYSGFDSSFLSHADEHMHLSPTCLSVCMSCAHICECSWTIASTGRRLLCRLVSACRPILLSLLSLPSRFGRGLKRRLRFGFSRTDGWFSATRVILISNEHWVNLKRW